MFSIDPGTIREVISILKPCRHHRTPKRVLSTNPGWFIRGFLWTRRCVAGPAALRRNGREGTDGNGGLGTQYINRHLYRCTATQFFFCDCVEFASSNTHLNNSHACDIWESPKKSRIWVLNFGVDERTVVWRVEPSESSKQIFSCSAYACIINLNVAYLWDKSPNISKHQKHLG